MLFVVDRVLAIKERGTLVGGRLIEPETARFYIGDTVEIRRSDGSIVQSTITGIPMSVLKGEADVLLPDLDHPDVRLGDELWVNHGHSSDPVSPQ